MTRMHRFLPRASLTFPLLRTSALLLFLSVGAAVSAKEPDWLSPSALVPSPDGTRLYVVCATAQRLEVLDVATEKVNQSIDLPGRPNGLAVSPEDGQLFVTCGGAEGFVAIVDPAKGRVTARMKAGHSPTAPVLSSDGRTLYVCNRFNNDVAVYDLQTRKELRRIKVQREPVAAAMTQDGRFLLVANLLHQGRADAADVSAVVSLIRTADGKVVKELRLPNGSGSLNDIRVSPDGKFAVVTHLLSRFHLPTTQLDRGWMNTNAKTIIDLERMEVLNTVLLDNIDRGAANPWGIAWSADSRTLVIAHAGTHEISVIDFPAVLAKLDKIPREEGKGQAVDYSSASRVKADVPNDLAFLVGMRRRIKLPEGELGPRAVVMLGTKVYVANYFSDTVTVLDTKAEYPKWKSLSLGAKPVMNAARKGELYFHDARICFQGWQSCASCHPGDARVDALNWDLLNDGVGNPKNNKSLLLALRTPPAMSRGVRETGEEAVRAGIRHILFSVQPEEVPKAMEAYLESLKPVPSPLLESGSLSRAARRGKKLFQNDEVGCASCHPAGLLTDLKSYDVGTAGQFDKAGDVFDTPTLVELWRTAPYLHDGSASTGKELLTTRNAGDRHGKTSHLTPQQIDDLVQYLLSL